MPVRPMSRRTWLRRSSTLCGSALALGVPLPRAWSAEGVGDMGANDLSRIVHDTFVAEVRQIMQQRVLRLKSLQTKADAEGYVKSVQDAIQSCFGPWPEKTPLNARVTGVVERDVYRVEKVIFESRPGFFVTANLYVPKGLKGKVPGVVGSCGHSHNGKAAEPYQSFAQGLARLGYVVLIFDPIGQGERLQLPGKDPHKSRAGGSVGEHMMCGNQQFLVGEFFGSWRAWDGIRALDYLLTREEVDPQHVGVTGNSGGGTMTTWLCGVERRWTMGAPSCFVTSFLRNLENELPADTEQCPPRVLQRQLDHGDFLIAMAPKPIIILGQEKDYFDARGLYATYEQVREVYKLLGAEHNVSYHIGPGGHGYQKDAREAMYAHFNRATGRGSGAVGEPALTIEEDATLACTKSGQVSELKSRPVYSFTQETATRLAAERGEVSGQKLHEVVGQVTREIRRSLSERISTKQISSPDYRILRPRREPAYPREHVTTYLLESSLGEESLLYRIGDVQHHSRPPKHDKKPAILYVSHDSCDLELRSEPLIRELIKEEPGAVLYAVDLFGIGETRPNTCGVRSYYAPYGCDYFYAAHAIMLGTSCVTRRTAVLGDVLKFLQETAEHDSIHLAAQGYGTIPAALQAIACPAVNRVTLKHGLTSYQDVVNAEVYQWPLSSFVPGVLRHFDLPDVYREVAKAKHLRMIEPWNADKQTV